MDGRVDRRHMTRWDDLSSDETAMLQTVFWSAGASRLALANRMACSKSKANSLVASLIDQPYQFR